jgi:transcriptional regulator with XRE-family HTH domain
MDILRTSCIHISDCWCGARGPSGIVRRAVAAASEDRARKADNECGVVMHAEDFRSWRKALGWKQKDAAERLGLKKRVIQYYEKGDRDGKPVEIPKTVELACLAVTLGYTSYDGRMAETISPPEPVEAAIDAVEDEPIEAPEAPAEKPAAKAPPKPRGKARPASVKT